MAEQNLKFVITGDTSGLNKATNKAEKDLKDLGTAAQKSTKGISNMDKVSGNATATLTAFGGVIQDAPYGIRGVANNIEFLTAQFGNLSRQSGGAKNAFKALLGSLTGPAGILLAVSTVTSLMVAFGDELFSTKNETQKLKEENEKFVDGLNDYVDGLDAVNRARVRGAQDAAKEITTLGLLRSQIENTNISNDKRLDAAKELKRLYPSYLENLSAEKILTTDLSTTYDNLTTSILKKARAQAASEQIIENVKQELAIEKQLSDLQEQISAANLDANKKEAAAIEAISKNLQGQSTLQAKATTAREKVNTLTESQIQLQGRLNKLQEDNLRLQTEVITQGGVSTEDTSEDENKEREKAAKEAQRIAERNAKILAEINKDNFKNEQGLLDERIKANEAFAEAYSKITEDIDPFAGLGDKITEDFNNIIAQQEKLQNRSEILTDAVGSAFNALSSEISRTLQTGNTILDAFVGSLVSSLTQAAATLLQSSITEAIIGQAKNAATATVAQTQGVLIATQAAAALGPAGLPALPGLLASTQALITGSLALAQVPKFAQGGIVPGGSFTGDSITAMVNSGEMILTNRQQSNLFSLLNNGVLGNSNESNGDIVATTILRGQNQVLQLKRAEKRNKRFFG